MVGLFPIDFSLSKVTTCDNFSGSPRIYQKLGICSTESQSLSIIIRFISLFSYTATPNRVEHGTSRVILQFLEVIPCYKEKQDNPCIHHKSSLLVPCSSLCGVAVYLGNCDINRDNLSFDPLINVHCTCTYSRTTDTQ